MNEQIRERGGTLETDVAVIQSNYVRREEFSTLREEVGIAFAKVNAKIDVMRAELNAKIDLMHVELNGKIDIVHAELSGKMDAGFAQVNARIDRSTTTLLKWMFASQISVAAMLIVAVKYL